MNRTTHKIFRLVRKKIRKKLRNAYAKMFDPKHTPWVLEHCEEIGPAHNHIYVALCTRRNLETFAKEYGVIESFMKNDVETSRREKVVTKHRWDHIRDMMFQKHTRFH